VNSTGRFKPTFGDVSISRARNVLQTTLTVNYYIQSRQRTGSRKHDPSSKHLYSLLVRRTLGPLQRLGEKSMSQRRGKGRMKQERGSQLKNIDKRHAMQHFHPADQLHRDRLPNLSQTSPFSSLPSFHTVQRLSQQSEYLSLSTTQEPHNHEDHGKGPR
jgi:hypothetical protein